MRGITANIIRINAKINIQIISLFKISGSIKIGFIIAVIPRTDPILKIFEPIKLPTEIPSSFFAIATKDAASSGTLVPMATIVTDITASLILICLAKLIEPSTKKSAPK